jgi:hypothetical protein
VKYTAFNEMITRHHMIDCFRSFEGNGDKKEYTRSPSNLADIGANTQQTRIDHILYIGTIGEVENVEILPRRAYISKDHATVQATIGDNPTAYNKIEDIQKAKGSLHRKKYKTYQYSKMNMKKKINSADSLRQWCISRLQKEAKTMDEHQIGKAKEQRMQNLYDSIVRKTNTVAENAFGIVGVNRRKPFKWDFHIKNMNRDLVKLETILHQDNKEIINYQETIDGVNH